MPLSGSRGVCNAVPIRRFWPAGAGGDGTRIPAVLSGEGSLPEVGGDAALYFDARDEASMAAVLMDIISDPELRTLRGKGPRKCRSIYMG